VSSNPFAQGARAFGYTGSEQPTAYWDNYEEAGQKKGGGKGPIPAGRYTLRIPEPGESFRPAEKKGDNDSVTFLIDLTVVAPAEFAGRQVRFARFSNAAPAWRDGSMAGDLLKACRIEAKPRTPDEWFSIAPFLAGKTFDADVELSLYDKETRQPIYKRAADFPTRADGSPMTILVLHADGTPVLGGSTLEEQRAKEDAAIAAGGRKLFANNDIKRVYPST
jgi:hypothetical protein